MDTKILKPAPLAYENEQFLKSPDGRVLRILAEYSEPFARFRREQIQDTVVFFGSARFQSMEDAESNLATIRSGDAKSDDYPTNLKRAQAAVEMTRYYKNAPNLASILTE